MYARGEKVKVVMVVVWGDLLRTPESVPEILPC